MVDSTTIVSDLHGPAHGLTFLGAPVVDLLPVSTLSGNLTVAFADLSYAGSLTVTVVADPDRCQDLPDLARLLQAELDVLARPVSHRRYRCPAA